MLVKNRFGKSLCIASLASLSLIGSSFAGSAFATHSVPATYTCECIDTGLECDGMENMTVAVVGNVATIELGNMDWEINDGYTTERNPDYQPRSEAHEAYEQFKITEGGGLYDYDLKRSNFLIEKTLIRGEAAGSVKFQSVASGEFYSWLFDCTRD